MWVQSKRIGERARARARCASPYIRDELNTPVIDGRDGRARLSAIDALTFTMDTHPVARVDDTVFYKDTPRRGRASLRAAAFVSRAPSGKSVEPVPPGTTHFELCTNVN